MNYQTAEFVAKSIDDLEHKIRVAAPACYPEFDRDLLNQSLLTVIARDKDSPRLWDRYITNQQELFLLLAYHNQCEAEEAFRNKDIAGALIFVAEGNFEIGCFYGSHHITREGKKAAAKAPRERDSLAALIYEEVKKKPDISEKELLQKLMKLRGLGVITDIDDKNIWFIDRNKPEEASVSVSLLRSRLSRAKNKIKKNNSP